MQGPGDAGQPAFLEWSSAGFGAELVRLTTPEDTGASPGKRPVDAEWQTLAVTPEIVARWARQHANVGLRTRQFPAVDVDVDDAAIAAAVEQLVVATLGPTARRTRANSGRRALLFRVQGSPFKKRTVGFKLPDGTFARIEVLANGQQLVVAGMHASGVPNAWPEGQPRADALAPMSEAQCDELVALLRVRLAGLGCVLDGKSTPAPNGAQRPAQRAPRPFPASTWERDAELAEEALARLDPDMAYEDWLRIGMALHAKDPSPGGAAFEFWDRWSSAGQKYPGREALEQKWKTFKQGGVHFATLLAAAGVSPKKHASIPRAATAPATNGAAPSAAPAANHDEAEEEELLAIDDPYAVPKGPPLTDLGNAERFEAKHHKVARYVPGIGWLIWNGRRWEPDAAEEVLLLARAIAREMRTEAAELSHKDGLELFKHANATEKEQRLGAMVRLARPMRRLRCRTRDLDSDPYLLNVLNGTVDLRTGKLRPHRREDLITRIAPVNFDPNARAPRWEAFLRRILGESRELESFVQRAIGYALTGSIDEHVMFFMHGSGRNGKGTLLEVLLELLGEYAWKAGSSLLLSRDASDAKLDQEKARLFNRRFVVCSETDEGRSWAEATLKELTGGDTVNGREVYKAAITFKPTHKFFVASNHKPRLRGTDEGIRSRLRLVPFNVFIPPAEREKGLPQRLVREEGPGILSWAVRGCLAWKGEGLGEPPEVASATDGYFADEDIVGRFIAERCVVLPTAQTTFAALYEDYESWCKASGERPMTKKALGERLGSRGFTPGYVQRNRGWLGLGLRAATDATERSAISPNISHLPSSREEFRETASQSVSSVTAPQPPPPGEVRARVLARLRNGPAIAADLASVSGASFEAVERLLGPPRARARLGSSRGRSSRPHLARDRDLVMSESVLRPPRPLTVAQVAHRLGCSPFTVRRLLEAKKLVGYRLGREWRVTLEAVEAFILRREE